MRRARRAAALAAVLVACVAVVPALGAPSDDPVPRLAGPDRYATAARIAADQVGARPSDERPTAAVLARGDAFADALAGVPLAHHLGAPLLLTRPDELVDVTRTALDDLLAPGATIHVVGGRAALAPAVADALRAEGWRVRRHAGETRYGTAAAIAAALPASTTAYVASGVEPADALAAAPVAARLAAPVLLTAPATLPDETRAALEAVERVVLVGGPAAVSEDVAAELAASHDVERVAGEDRFATAVAISTRTPAPVEGVALASGRSFSDALAGAAHAAATGAVLLLSDTDRLTWPTATEVARRGALPVVIHGGEVAVAPGVEDDVRLAQASDPGAPRPVRLEPGRQVVGGERLQLQFSRTVRDADVTTRPPADGAPQVRDDRLVLRTPTTQAPASMLVRGSVTDRQGRVRWFAEQVTLLPPRTSHEGFHVAPGSGPVVGASGPLVAYTVEVEAATGHSLDEVRPVVEDALEDTERGWTARGGWRLQRVGDPQQADIRVVLATPDTVDEHCARVGLNTAGRLSCWDGRRAMLNVVRWERGAPDFGDDVRTYRRYQVNHEVGHGLGRTHTTCPASGAPAPIMMQQTKSVGACAPNGWPYP